jgi:peptidoglycan biosynthesis protein MviN/MurJ (putative lipid II flippase)
MKEVSGVGAGETTDFRFLRRDGRAGLDNSRMFLKAGALSLALLLASRLLGLARESAQAAAFGTSGVADVVVLMLTLPDWVVGVLASGALAYALLPAWAGQSADQVRQSERRVGWGLLAGGAVLALLLVLLRRPAVAWLASGMPGGLVPAGAAALIWSALALPAALLAALWATRLQHDRDFTGMYSANLVVNAALIAAITAAALIAPDDPMRWLGPGLLSAMLLRLVWLRSRRPAAVPQTAMAPSRVGLPPATVWLWAALAAGLPLALPFAARSMASQSGAGALATFNYAWKLVELPLVLAIQLVAALALPAIARTLAAADAPATRTAVRAAFALAWALACAATAMLMIGAPAIAKLLFGWGRMDPQALARVAHWGALGAWGLLPQALIAVAVTVLAGLQRMQAAVLAYGVALAVLLTAGAFGWSQGASLMLLLNVLFGGVALVVIASLGPVARDWLPFRAMAISLSGLLILAGIATQGFPQAAWGVAAALAAAGIAGALVMATTWWGSDDLRAALAR